MKKTIRRARQAGLSNIDLLMMKESARKQVKGMEKEAVEKAFLYMLAIPVNILAHEHWPKSAKKMIPKFISDVMSLFKSVEQGIVDEEDLHNVLQEYAGIDIREEWYKNKEVKEGSDKRIYKL